MRLQDVNQCMLGNSNHRVWPGPADRRVLWAGHSLRASVIGEFNKDIRLGSGWRRVDVWAYERGMQQRLWLISKLWCRIL